MRHLAAVAILSLCLFEGWGGLTAPPARAAAACGDPLKIAAELLEKYREEPVIRADGATGALLLLYASPEGTWSGMVVKGGVGCLVMAGKNWTGPRPKPGAAS